MNADELKQRTKRFALRAINLTNALPNSPAGRVLGNQFLRAATSVGANHRAATRARSHAEFIAKVGIVEEEADESCYWLELIVESRLLPAPKVEPLLREAGELTAIFTASGRTAKTRAAKPIRDQRSAIRNSQ